MKARVLKLGTFCKDKATGLSGTLTHWIIDMDGRIIYLFQPKGLDEEGQPVKHLLLGAARLEVSDYDFEVVDVPFDILGSQVMAQSSGFNGMAIKFIYHINGCFHVAIQPKGVVEKTKLPVLENDFDLRECIGEKIPELSREKLEQSKKEKPSPTGDRVPSEMPKSLL